jgi:hypothetical protein
MAYIVAALTALFIALLVYTLRAQRRYPTFTDEQLLNQHCRFLEELEASSRYMGGNYVLEKERGSPAEHELAARGYDVRALLAERIAAENEGREMNWNACRRGRTGRLE